MHRYAYRYMGVYRYVDMHNIILRNLAPMPARKGRKMQMVVSLYVVQGMAAPGRFVPTKSAQETWR